MRASAEVAATLPGVTMREDDGASASTGAHISAPVDQALPRLERLILHHLDQRTGAVRLVEEPARLDAQSAHFFCAHIIAAMHRADWHAHFGEPQGEVATLCRRLLLGPTEFVAASQVLALRLYDQMRARPRQIAPGDFVALVYEQDGRRHVALLKLDPDVRLARTFSRAGGRLRVSISAADNLLPSADALQKCALLREGVAGAFEVTLLDTQAGPRSGGVAAFFYRGFLGVVLAPSARRRTRLFLTATEAWLAGWRDALAPIDLLRFYRARRAALGADVLILAAFVADALPNMPTAREALLAALETALFAGEPVEPGFAVDRATANPVVRFVTLELDGGARLRVEAAQFDALVRVGERRVDAKLRLIIETLTLKEVGGI
jgi:hypothetical protein